MKRLLKYIFFVLVISGLFLDNLYAGIGDGGMFDGSSTFGQQKEENNDSNSPFGEGVFFEEEPMTSHEGPDIPIFPDEVPLDGGAIALLISGGLFGIRKLFNQKKA